MVETVTFARKNGFRSWCWRALHNNFQTVTSEGGQGLVSPRQDMHVCDSVGSEVFSVDGARALLLSTALLILIYFSTFFTWYVA